MQECVERRAVVFTHPAAGKPLDRFESNGHLISSSFEENLFTKNFKFLIVYAKGFNVMRCPQISDIKKEKERNTKISTSITVALHYK
jgi:hypothetical protein